MSKRSFVNPFRYGDLAFDDAFTDRETEAKELKSDIRNGQNVVIFAPRRYGKSSLLRKVTQELITDEGVLIAQVDLMATPSKEKLAEKLAESIYNDIASPLFRARDKAVGVFSHLRIRPVMTIDPNDGSINFTFEGTANRDDIDSTLEKLFELPARLASDRKKRAALVIDEFQEILDIDPKLPTLMRSIFQKQPDVSHIYLGSKRSMMERIFNDPNEPFWRSAKKTELGLIVPSHFAPFIKEKFETTDRKVDPDVVDAVLAITSGHPYGTQELCYFLWEETSEGQTAHEKQIDFAVTKVLRSEHAHFSRIWSKSAISHRLILQAIAKERVIKQISNSLRQKHGLPADPTVRKALKVMIEDELIIQDEAGFRIAEPFFAEWIRRYQI
jgi:AAA+ ATPase superfamily predicted ATPase